jgi:hypothetical protein
LGSIFSSFSFGRWLSHERSVAGLVFVSSLPTDN